MEAIELVTILAQGDNAIGSDSEGKCECPVDPNPTEYFRGVVEYVYRIKGDTSEKTFQERVGIQ